MKHLYAGGFGLIIGVALVFWAEPDTNAGAVFIVVGATIACFVVAGILTFVGRLFAKRQVP